MGGNLNPLGAKIDFRRYPKKAKRRETANVSWLVEALYDGMILGKGYNHITKPRVPCLPNGNNYSFCEFVEPNTFFYFQS